MLNFASADVNGSPLWKRTPERRRNVHVVGAVAFHSVARPGWSESSGWRLVRLSKRLNVTRMSFEDVEKCGSSFETSPPWPTTSSRRWVAWPAAGRAAPGPSAAAAAPTQGGSALEERAPREPAGPPRRHQVVEIHGALLVGSECRAGIVAGALFRPRASLAGRTPRRAWTSMSGVPPALLSRGAGPSQGPGRAAAATMGTRPVVRPPVPAREDTVADRDLCFTPAGELVRLFRSRRASPLEVVQAVLARIDAVNPGLNAYVTVARESALAAARRATAALRRGVVLPPLHGVPGSIKDLTPTAGIRTTWGSRIFEHHVPAED